MAKDQLDQLEERGYLDPDLRGDGANDQGVRVVLLPVSGTLIGPGFGGRGRMLPEKKGPPGHAGEAPGPTRRSYNRA